MRIISGNYGGRPLKTLEGKTTRPTSDKVRAQAVIEANIRMTKEGNKFQLLKMDAARALTNLNEQFDLIFLDPPYAKEEIMKTIEELCQRKLLSEEVMVVCETDKAVELPEEVAELGIWKQKIYGISKVTVYVR